MKLSEIMLQCIARGDEYVAELVIDFFTAVAEVPIVHRPFPLQVQTLCLTGPQNSFHLCSGSGVY